MLCCFFFLEKYILYSKGKYFLIFLILVNFCFDKILLFVCMLKIICFLLLFSLNWLLLIFIMLDLFFRSFFILLLIRIYFLYEIRSLIFFKNIFNFFLCFFYEVYVILLRIILLIGLLSIKMFLFCDIDEYNLWMFFILLISFMI